MTYAKLRSIADEDSITLDPPSIQTAIVTVNFAVSGLQIRCQYDEENVGLYAFRFADEDIGVILNAIKTTVKNNATS